jgi:TetR/AcrR family transcriptional regulator, acrAB operon repressor
MRRTKEDAAITRDSVLRAALAVFSRQGYSAATLEDVAREAGVTRGAIYWHFGSKVELYRALLNQYASSSGAIVQAAAAEGGTFVEILRRVFIRLLEAVEDNPDLRAVMEISLFKTERVPELAESQAQQVENSRGLLAGIAAAVQQGIASGELRSDLGPVEIARAFLALQNGAVYLWLFDPASFSLKSSAPALAEVFLKGISIQGQV